MISVENLSVAFGRKTIIRELNFILREESFTAIIGPNGSGKSTLLRALAGEIEYSGKVTMNGFDLSKMSAGVLANIRGVLPQSSSVAFPFSVSEIVEMGLRAGVFGHRTGQSNTIQLAALENVGLSGFENKKYHELSGGEQQRVQLARVLCQIWEPKWEDDARWLLLDEPVASLDILHQLEVMNLARNYANNGGGVISVMHDLNLTAMFADHVLLMKDGMLLKSGSPKEVISDRNLADAFSCNLRVGKVPKNQHQFVLPQSVEN
ncbi:MAG: heme ABC transporter ATP-binding protein [Pseudomonadota bacterium]